MASDANEVAFSNESFITIDIPTPKVIKPIINIAFQPIDNLEYFPEAVLLHIFSNVDDEDLLHLFECCYRFEGITKIAFKRRYANKYFVFDGNAKNDPKMYADLFDRFVGDANIRAVMVKSFQSIDENHWIPKLLVKHIKSLERLIFHRCWFERISMILQQHPNITHLTIRLGVWNDLLSIPNYRHLKKLEMNDNNTTALYDKRTFVRAMQNNPGLESLNFSRCDPSIPIHCIAKHTRHLKELSLICTKKDVWQMSDETMDSVADSLKHLELLRLTIRNAQSIELVNRLSITCENLKLLELDNKIYDRTISSDDIVEAAAQFSTIETLELTHVRSFNSIGNLVTLLPTLLRLRHLKLFMDKPQRSSKFIASLFNATPSLKTITINAWNDATFSWPKFLTSKAIFKEVIKTIRQQARFREELKEFQPYFGFVTNKEFIRCDERSFRVKHYPIHFSFDLVFLFFIIAVVVCAFPFILIAYFWCIVYIVR